MYDTAKVLMQFAFHFYKKHIVFYIQHLLISVCLSEY